MKNRKSITGKQSMFLVVEKNFWHGKFKFICQFNNLSITALGKNDVLL